MSLAFLRLPDWLVGIAPAVILLEVTGSTYGAPWLVSVGLIGLLVLAAAWGSWGAPRRGFAEPRAVAPRLGPSSKVRGGLAALALVAGLTAMYPLLAGFFVAAPLRFDVGVEWLILRMTVGAALLAQSVELWSSREVPGRRLARWGLLSAVGLLGLTAGGHRVQGLPVSALQSVDLWTLRGYAALLLGLCFVRHRRWAVGVIVAGGLLLQARALGLWQLDPRVRDMLPLVKSAQDALLNGEAPYRWYPMQVGSEVPLTYLPGLWLGYAWPRLLGLDLRWAALAAEGVVAAVLLRAVERRPLEQRAAATGLLLASLALWWSSPSVTWNAIYAEPHWWWGVLVVALWYGARGTWWQAGLALGVALATRHFAIALLLPTVASLRLREGWQRALQGAAVAVAVAAVSLLPFVLSRPQDFWGGTVRWLFAYGPAHRDWFLLRLGLAGTFYAHHAEEWLAPLQGAVLVTTGWLALRARSPRRLAPITAGSYVLVVALNRIIWDSFWLELALVVTSLALMEPKVRPRAHSEPSRWWSGSLAGLAALGLASPLLLSAAQSLRGDGTSSVDCETMGARLLSVAELPRAHRAVAQATAVAFSSLPRCELGGGLQGTLMVGAARFGFEGPPAGSRSLLVVARPRAGGPVWGWARHRLRLTGARGQRLLAVEQRRRATLLSVRGEELAARAEEPLTLSVESNPAPSGPLCVGLWWQGAGSPPWPDP